VAETRTYEWHDNQLLVEASSGLDGLALMRAVLKGRLPGPPIAATMDMRMVEADAGRVVFAIEASGWHYNAIGSVHGGVYATVLDSAAACAVHTTLPAGVGYTSVDLSVKFLRAATRTSGVLRCEGVVVHAGRRTALATAQLTDAAGKLYATATSTCLILRPEAGAS
jgi:uncharacterized protein (TIGR00369 family)